MKSNTQEVSSIILLEHPRPDDPERHQDVVNAPLSANLLTPYISAVLKSHKMPAEIINANLMRWSMQQTLDEIKTKPPKLLAVHMVYVWDKTAGVFDMLSRLRVLCPRTHISLYGFYPTFSYDNILKQFPFIDSVAIGEAEFTLLELSKSLLDDPAPETLGQIEGLAFARIDAATGERRIIKNRPRVLNTELDGLPFPDRSDMWPHEKRGITTYVLGSRGCYGHCTFCYINPFYTNNTSASWRGRSAENVFQEIKTLYRDRGIRDFYFADANFFGPGRDGKQRASQLAGLIIKDSLKIRFGIECRANDVEEQSLSRLVDAGLREVFLGIESGCQHVLNRFKKGVSIGANEGAVKTLRRLGIEPTLGFIMFHPGSTLADVRENFEFLRKLELLRTPAVTAHILHHGQTFFRGTPDFQRVIELPQTTAEPLTGYEAFCEFSDPKVAAFSEAAVSLCRGVLDMLQPDDADVCNVTREDGMLAGVNELLISAYDDVLSRFEHGDNDETMEDLKQMARRIHDETLRAVKNSLYENTGMRT
ncbi:MAG: B12-binding domain-containing radical SAM protein [Candidatus Brocadiales bacterium]|nr:B12-binding domain-containing radical SAM protein [Candidatus Bathyanammoxibius amoris]